MSKPRRQLTERQRTRGVGARWEMLITPAQLIAAGFHREARWSDRKRLRDESGRVADIPAFCERIGYSTQAFFKVQAGKREPTETFRIRAAAALGVTEDQLFRRTLVGQ